MEPNSQADRTAAIPSEHGYHEHPVPRGRHRIYAREYPGQEPAIVLMHGFPDDLHLYDRLVPELAGRRVVAFDFLGWGASDKPRCYPYTAANQAGDPDAVLQHLRLASVVLVARDASGPPPSTGHWSTPSGSPRWCCSTPITATCQGCGRWRRSGCSPPRWSGRSPARSRGCSATWGSGPCTAGRWGRFFRDPQVREEFLPLLYRQFAADPSAHAGFFGLNRDLCAALAAGTAAVPRLRRFGRPVRIVFGAADPYLNAGVARRFHTLFPTSELFLLSDARHYVQMDQPQQVARLLLTIPKG